MIVSGCSKKIDSVALNNIYTANAAVTMNGTEYSLSMSRLGNGVWDFTYTSPASLEGMSVATEDGKTKITYKGLETEIEKENMSSSAICEIIAGILDSGAIGTDVTFYETSNNVEAKGKWKDCDYIIILDKESCQLKGIIYNCKDFTADISDYQKMQ